MSLREVLDTFVASEAFERLLLSRDRPLVARADGGDAVVIAAIATALDGSVLAVAAGNREAEALAEDVDAFVPGAVALLPAWEALPYEGISPAADVAARRAFAVHRLREARGAFVLVAPPLAAMQGLIPTLGGIAPLQLAAGVELPPDALAEKLEAFGYARVDVVERRGEFAVRGGVLDVFPGTARRPIRLEFWGDEIESLRDFSPSTQLSTGRLGQADVGPVRELILDEEIRTVADERSTDHGDRFDDLLRRIADGLHPEGMETAAPFLFDAMPTPAELLPAGAWVVLTQAGRTQARAKQAYDDAEALADAVSWPGPRIVHALDDALQGRPRLHLTEFTEGLDLEIRSWGSAQGNPTELAQRLRDLRNLGYRATVTARAHGSLDRVREVLGEVAADAEEAPLTNGFVVPAIKRAVATEEDVFGARRHTRSAPRFTSRRTDAVAEELEPGEFAVHRIHGVARYAGIVHRALAGSERDYLVLEYAHGDKLYVPSDAVGMVAKYIGGDAPRLHRMGGSDWARATAKVKRAVRDMAGELVRLYTVRMSVPGHAFGSDTPWQHELEDAFPFEETPDQLRVIDEVKFDMERSVPMDRLLLGDVGFGKTEVAVRAAFKAAMEGKQVAVLAPTTLLAEQHFLTFTERFAPFPVTVKMLSRFVPPPEQTRVIDDVRAGKVDVVIGTHRLLSKDLSFKDLGLLVVDEEQRFGVSHKERLKALRAQVDVLTMTATPIPRTLEMALTGIRQMSTIDTPPEDRQAVLTYVGSYDEDLALGAVRRELLREGQVFWVHNRVATIDRQAHWLQEQLPEARVVVAHGQMDEDELEQQMVRFWDRDGDVLVCTTIIESGLDVPNANTLVVDRADTLGLAQLYQLRGRVGRSTERAFAYLFFPAQREMTEEAHQRLATVAQHQALGSGFQIAMRDLEIRGAGNLLGAEQSGHIAAVGFDAYARILQESVRELQGLPVEVDRELRIDLPVKAFVPPGWVAQESLRLELYRRISMAADHAVLAEVRTETIDRYGALPEEVEVLFGIASLRLTARRLGATEITTFRDQVRISPVPLPDAMRLDLGERVPGATFHPTKATLNLTPERVFGVELVRWVEARLREAVGEPGELGLALDGSPEAVAAAPEDEEKEEKKSADEDDARNEPVSRTGS
jgi:transcription-repair coupling factor (superfamily II helicase)